MKIPITQQLTELDGSPMITSKRICQMCAQPVSTPEPMTVRVATTRALGATFRDEQNLMGDQKIIRFKLAVKLFNEDNPSLTAEEVTLIKKLVGKLYGPIVVGQVWAILDPQEETTHTKVKVKTRTEP